MAAPRTHITGLLLATLALVCLGACTDDEANAKVTLCGDLSVPDDMESVRVAIYDQNRNPIRQGVRELWTCPGPTLRRLPQTLEFEPVQGDVFVEVQGLKDGAPVIRAELRTNLTASNHTATVSLTQSCMGARCGAGETCVDGSCELVALASKAVSRCAASEPDAGPDAASDTNTDTTDAGSPPDTGAADTGTANDAADTGPPPGAYLCPQEDAGSDDPGSDAGEGDTGQTNADGGGS